MMHAAAAALNLDTRPAAAPSYDKYTIAWICALHIEMAAAHAMLDDIYDQQPAGQASSDCNTYTLGRVGQHNTVVACLPVSQYGTNSAVNVLTNLVRTFSSVRLALMVGIGGGVPTEVDVRLGDIVVGTKVVQHDLGRRTDRYLELTAVPRTIHPSFATAVSKLRSKHELEPSRVPSIWSRSCEECDVSRLKRRASRTARDPVIHYGAIASGNQVLRDATTRDDVAQRLGVICFEMEAAGLMDVCPCLPIRGICDYADSHKSKEWQRYAAANAAAYAREMLEVLPAAADDSPGGRCLSSPRTFSAGVDSSMISSSISDRGDSSREQPHFMVPFGRNKDFVGRDIIIDKLLELIPPTAEPDDCQRAVIEGLGGTGKTQIALEMAFRLRGDHPDCSVFWVPALNGTSFESAYRGIGRLLRISGIDEGDADIISLVKTALNESIFNWLLIIDNADESQLSFSNSHFDIDQQVFAIFAQWLDSFHNEEPPSGRKGFEDRSRYEDSVNPVALTWFISFERISQESRHAVQYLSFMCFLAEKGIPYAFLPLIGVGDTDELEEEIERDEAIGILKAYSCISGIDSHVFEMHRLVRLATRNWLEAKQTLGQCLAAVMRRLEAVLPTPTYDNRELWLSYLPHAQSAVHASRGIDMDIDEVESEIRFRMGICLHLMGKYEDAEEYYRASMRLRERVMGKLHPKTLKNMDSLVNVLRAQGQCWEAEQLHRQTYELCAQLLGEDDPTTGQLEDAERLHRMAVELRTAIHGPVAAATLAAQANLASLLDSRGQHEEAEHIYRQTDSLMSKVYGERHHHTLVNRNNLAGALARRNQHDEAEAMYRETLRLWQQLLAKSTPKRWRP
ncbi:hypothetical protein NLG97_g9941 [Lecanicillium saksenae]|uniref:Uncharacterized protein n=1 Tax=Lecanicillium saksenae TaxID=468837 RepID=A0ACC1QIJ8_9HYPO|nr:hypothetical protein NLG97_g9941 [Lecanicillium saksenae]